jgi:hypothetical protein
MSTWTSASFARNPATALRALLIGLGAEFSLGLAVYMAKRGLLVRIPLGVHAYAALIAFTSFTLYALHTTSFRRAAAYPFVYYSYHEAIFNAFFLSYHMRLPPFSDGVWWAEFAFQLLVAAAALRHILHRGGYAAFELTLLLVGLFEVWELLGFPVTANIFGAPVNTPLANGFEAAYSFLFTAWFLTVY